MEPTRPPREETKKQAARVECPCCGAKLFYDPVLKSLRTTAPGSLPGKDVSFDAALSALRADKEMADEKFQAAIEKEGKRKESLEKRFAESLREADNLPEPPLRPIDLD